MMMAATRRGLLFLPCIISLLLLNASAVVSSTPPTLIEAAAGSGDLPAEPSAYEMLEGFGFPRGILPVGVTGYKYRPSDGAFEVYLDEDCEFEVGGGYRLTYRRTVSGNVGDRSIRNLGGVSVRMFLLDWGINRVVMEDPGRRLITFYVGPLSQAFPADGFEESPECRSCRRRSSRGGGDSMDAMDNADGVAAM